MLNKEELEQVIALKDAGFTAEEINLLLNNSSHDYQKKEMKVEEKLKEVAEQKEEIKVEESANDNHENQDEISTYFNSFKEEMNKQMEDFKKAIQLSNNFSNIGKESDEGLTSEQVIAHLINPYSKEKI